MSLSDEKHRGMLPTELTNYNWNTWIINIKDMILALNHDEAPDIWQAYIWV